MAGAGTVAGFVNDAIFPGHRKFTAGRGALLIDTAGDAAARLALQRNAARRAIVCAAHIAHQQAQWLSEIDWHYATGIIGFSPVKGNTEIGAAGATGHTRVGYIAHLIARHS